MIFYNDKNTVFVKYLNTFSFINILYNHFRDKYKHIVVNFHKFPVSNDFYKFRFIFPSIFVEVNLNVKDFE